MEKIYIITENYRNEKCGDSTEEIKDFWSDGDDEYETVFQIDEVEEI